MVKALSCSIAKLLSSPCRVIYSWKAAMHPAYYTPLAPYPNFRLPESSIGFNAELAMDNWEKGENAACQISGLKHVWLEKEGDAPWNKLHHRIIPLWNILVRRITSHKLFTAVQ